MSKRSRVLYVDPDPAARDRVRPAIDGLAGIDGVITASDESEARACLERAAIRAVVTEHRLDGVDGIELCERVRERWPTVPVVLYTAHGSERVASRALAAGMTGYVPKSEGPELLAERLAETLSLAAADRLEADYGTQRRDRSALIVDQAPLGIIEWHLDLTVEHWNPAAADLFGYDADEASGRHATELIVPEENEWAIRKGWQRLIDSGVGSHRVNRNVRADGTRITCEWYNEPLLDERGETIGVLSFVRDVTEDRQREQRLAVLNRVLRHDLRNRLTVIRGAAESVLAADDPSEVGQFTELVLEEADELDALVTETREINRIADSGDGARDVADVADVVGRVVEAVDDPGVDLSTSVPDAARARVHEAFPKAVFHLVENAVVHNDDPVEVSVNVECEDEAVAIRVADNGPGIPETERRLVNGDAEISQLQHGRGLGLWIVRWAVDRSGGRLTIDDDSRGTVVTVEVPAVSRSGDSS
jgi:PAS domain S-box-containing protein